MPRLSYFYGILIYMYPDDHNPPHFHAYYNEYEALITIKDLAMLEGKLPSKAHAMVIEWASTHQNELIDLLRKSQIIFSFGEESKMR